MAGTPDSGATSSTVLTSSVGGLAPDPTALTMLSVVPATLLQLLVEQTVVLAKTLEYPSTALSVTPLGFFEQPLTIP